MKPFMIGLTGQTGAGKTTAAGVMTEAYGGDFLPHIDCDRATRNILAEDEQAREDIMHKFPEFFTGREFDRRKAAALLFSDKALLARYDEAIFPHITRRINGLIAEIGRRFAESGEGMILLDAPTLFEAGIDGICDVIVSCIAPAELRMERIIARDGVTPEQAAARIASQHSDEFFRERSDYVIENTGDEQALRAAALAVIDEIVRSAV